jgi:hypothetical protein
MTCWETGESLKDLLATNAEVMRWLSTENLDQAFDMKAALSGVDVVYERIIGSAGPVIDSAREDHDRCSEPRRRLDE